MSRARPVRHGRVRRLFWRGGRRARRRHGDAAARAGEQRRHLAAGILIDAVQAHEGIEDEQPRLQLGNGLGEASAVGVKIKPDRGRGDDLDIQIGERYADGSTDAFEATAHDVQRVLGGVEKNATGA